MGIRHKYSERTTYITVSVCLFQLIVFVAVTVIENHKRDVLQTKLDTKRQKIANISARCFNSSQLKEHLLEKSCANDTKICLKGLKGDVGLVGVKGDIGSQGEPGLIGNIGVPGNDGQKGLPGNPGPKGSSGWKGSKGDGGVDGMRGLKGNIGNTGENGKSGIRGSRGPKGVQGTNGRKGPQGQKGFPGLKGSLGHVGDNGKIEFVDNTTVITAPLGTNIKLNCTTTPSQTVNWKHSSDQQCYPLNDGNVITINQLSPADLGEHVCTVNDGFHNIQKTIFVNSTENGHFATTYDNSTSRIESLWVKVDGQSCLTFWYRNEIIGSSPGSSIDVTTKGTSCPGKQTYVNKTIKDNQVTNWTQEFLQLPNTSDVIQFVFDVRTNNMVVSIDDISLLNGTCPLLFKFYEPENITLTIPLDGHGNINCSAEKPGDVLYSMTKMGSCQNLANTGIHTIQKASFSDAGTYVCKLISDGEVKTKFVTVNVTGNTNCTFENGICDWTQDQQDNQDWVSRSSTTPSSGTGPNSDHTFGDSTGHYMYFEASGGSQHDTAVLKSHMLSTGPYCLSMAYNMNGDSIGALNVYTKECNSTVRNKIWSVAGNKGEHWFDGCIKTPVLSQDYQIYIEAERGSTYASDIAIDDVNIHAGNCICSSKTVVRSCNFEQGLCQWHQLNTDDFDWTRLSGPTGSQATGPNNDHTTGNGYYLYIESSSPRTQDNKAELESTALPGGIQYCLTFYYNMLGATMGALHIYKEVTPSGKRAYLPPQSSLTSGTAAQSGVRSSTRTLLFTIADDHGATWHKQQVNIPVSTSDFKIILSGVVGTSFYSDLAIDDISITTGTC
ncbi:unnamed protein product [Mytilus edulis]|uniref:Uncharacterized protein n=1 Tax=Mytilus edulis TaxID=6550 RepID=A0A8S3UNV6_MYTED|nr:unnamed protein product [Mytilus edulis]